METNKQLSTTQPTELMKANHIKAIEILLSQGMEDMARKYDKSNKVGYFAARDESGKPHWEQWLNKFITVHPEMLALKQDVKCLMNISDSVLIQGETGTGKELIAHALHGDKDRETFIAINCAGLPEYLLESELFGHVKGAFTGADKDKMGLLAQANMGTIFLDEIGDMPYPLQAKLLRAIQERTIRRVGSNKDEIITCRFVAATHHSLMSLIEDKLFRRDLYERLSTFELKTLPIVQRLDDIPLIVESLDPDRMFPKDFDLREHPHLLDGNIRSIQKIVKRYQILRRLPE